jgi:quercetin dioxygenase-like cupin family protein
MVTVKKLSMIIAGATLSALCLGLQAAQAHPGHSPSVPHDITPLSKTAGQDVLVVPPDASDRPTYSVFTGFSTFLATREDTNGQFSLFDLSVNPNGGGPPPHIHNQQDEAFYVLDGDVQFLLGNQTTVGEPGTFVYVPKGRRHQFLNPGTTRASLLALTFPSGFEGFFAEEGKLVIDISNPPPPRTDFAEIAPIAAKYDTQLALSPEASENPGLQDFILLPPDAPNRPSFNEAGGLFTSLATNEETTGNFSLFDVSLAPQAGPGQVKINDQESQSFYVLDGEVTFQIGDQTTVGTPGTLVYLPEGTPYAFQNLGMTPARTLLLSTPTAVPEPTSTLGVLGLGACGIAALLKRKQKQQTLS